MLWAGFQLEVIILEIVKIRRFNYIAQARAQECVGGAVASWLVPATLERPVLARALAGNIVLCSWARHFTLTVPLSTQVYKWIPANLMLGVTLRWTSIPSKLGGVEILLVTSSYKTGISSGLMGHNWLFGRLYRKERKNSLPLVSFLMISLFVICMC